MVLDWITILDQEGVDYVTSGPNIARGNIGIACPFCGNDPSHHLGISLTKPAWGCWREPTHRGRRPHRLLRALIGSERAARYLTPDPIQQLAQNAAETPSRRFDRTVYEGVPTCPVPAQSELLDLSYVRYKPFANYLHKRGFVDNPLPTLRCAYYGRYAWRVLLPINYYADDRVVGWTGRAIGDATPRYLTTENADHIGVLRSSGQYLIVVEGPLDALKVYQALPEASVAFTAGIGLSSNRQVELQGLASRFNETFISFDPDAEWRALRAALSTRIRCLPPPAHRADLGECTHKEIRTWITQLRGSSLRM